MFHVLDWECLSFNPYRKTGKLVSLLRVFDERGEMPQLWQHLP